MKHRIMIYLRRSLELKRKIPQLQEINDPLSPKYTIFEFDTQIMPEVEKICKLLDIPILLSWPSEVSVKPF
jgi:hypothetical protein